jgi:hypothetical protein
LGKDFYTLEMVKRQKRNETERRGSQRGGDLTKDSRTLVITPPSSTHAERRTWRSDGGRKSEG